MLRQLSDDLRVKRGKLADAITAWQTDGSPMSQGDLVRDFLKSEQAERVRKRSKATASKRARRCRAAAILTDRERLARRHAGSRLLVILPSWRSPRLSHASRRASKLQPRSSQAAGVWRSAASEVR